MFYLPIFKCHIPWHGNVNKCYEMLTNVMKTEMFWNVNKCLKIYWNVNTYQKDLYTVGVFLTNSLIWIVLEDNEKDIIERWV